MDSALAEDWKAGGEAYFGVSIGPYPNLHQQVGPNAALGHHSITFMIEVPGHFALLDAKRAQVIVCNDRAVRGGSVTPNMCTLTPGIVSAEQRPIIPTELSFGGQTRQEATGMTTGHSRLVLAAVLVFSATSVHGQEKMTERTLKLATGAKSPHATMSDVAWLAGRRVDDGDVPAGT